MKLINKNIKAIAKYVAAEGNIRPILAGVCIRNGNYYATNSYIAVKFPVNEEKNDSSKFPIIDGENYNILDSEDIVISSKDIEQLKFNKNKFLPIIENMALANFSEGKLDIVSTDLSTSNIKKCRLIKGVFPDIDIFFNDIEKKENPTKIGIDVNLMIDLLKTFKECNIDRVIIEVRNPLDAVIIKGGLSDVEKYKAMIMPLKI